MEKDPSNGSFTVVYRDIRQLQAHEEDQTQEIKGGPNEMLQIRQAAIPTSVKMSRPTRCRCFDEL